MQDEALLLAVQRLQGSDASGADDVTVRTIATAIDEWMLRAIDHRPTVGAQIAEWLVRATRSGAEGQEGRAALVALGRAYQIDFASGVLPELDEEHHYSNLLPTPNPRAALEDGAASQRSFFQGIRSGRAPLSDVLDYANGYDRMVSGFYFMSMQLRATILRAALRAWWASRNAAERNDSSFHRLVTRAQQGEASLPHVPGSARRGQSDQAADLPPTCRDILGFLITEAVDDAFYAQYVAAPEGEQSGGRARDFAGGVALGLSANGLALLGEALARVAPRDDLGYGGDQDPILAYVAERPRYRVTAESRAGGDVVFVSRPVLPARAIARNTDATLHLGPHGYPFDVIIIPSFSPLEAAAPLRAIDPLCADRCREAKEAWEQGLAPFLLVSGAAIYPQGTRVFDADLMAAELRRLHVPDPQIILDRRARHSTTNLRNAGRIMLQRGLRGPALVVTSGPLPIFGQDFYFGNPNLSTFHLRCDGDLGYHPDEEMASLADWVSAQSTALEQALDDGPPTIDATFEDRFGRFLAFHSQLEAAADNAHYLVFTPSRDVLRWGIRDPLDP